MRIIEVPEVLNKEFRTRGAAKLWAIIFGTTFIAVAIFLFSLPSVTVPLYPLLVPSMLGMAYVAVCRAGRAWYLHRKGVLPLPFDLDEVEKQTYERMWRPSRPIEDSEEDLPVAA